MKSIKSGIFIAALGTLLSFLSVAYMSCSKAVLNPAICQDLICRNGGHCYSDTVMSSPRYNSHYCVCPLGWEGDSCTFRSTSKFVGTWIMNETYIGSNNASVRGYTRTYNDSFAYSSTPYIMFFVNFQNNPSLTEVPCLIDSTNNNTFWFKSYYPVNNGNYHIVGGKGVSSSPNGINSVHIDGVYYLNWQNPNFQGGFTNENDTVSFSMNKIY